MTIYRPGQASILFDVWPKEAEWFIIGGPSDANEAQTVFAQYPSLSFVGFEPLLAMLFKQSEMGFPGYLYPYALWDQNTNLELSTPKGNPRSSSVCRDLNKFEPSAVTVEARTLDSLSEELGPWENIVLWLDIEHAELEALRGAKKLLEKVLLVNVEVFKPHLYQPIADLLEPYGLVEIKSWNEKSMPGMRDVIFGKQ